MKNRALETAPRLPRQPSRDAGRLPIRKEGPEPTPPRNAMSCEEQVGGMLYNLTSGHQDSHTNKTQHAKSPALAAEVVEKSLQHLQHAHAVKGQQLVQRASVGLGLTCTRDDDVEPWTNGENFAAGVPAARMRTKAFDGENSRKERAKAKGLVKDSKNTCLQRARRGSTQRHRTPPPARKYKPAGCRVQQSSCHCCCHRRIGRPHSQRCPF